MNTWLWVLAAFVVYNVAGCVTLGLIDSEDKIMVWYRQAPGYLSRTVFWIFWPGVAVCYCWSRR